MAIVGQRRRRYRKHNFQVDVEGIQRATFMTCSDLKVTVEPIEIRESGDLETEKLPGLVNLDNVTLTWGSSDDLDFWTWMKQVADLRKQGGLTDDEVIRSMEIIQLERDKETSVFRWPIQEAWPTELTLGDWDANANEITIQTVVLSVRGLQDPVIG